MTPRTDTFIYISASRFPVPETGKPGKPLKRNSMKTHVSLIIAAFLAATLETAAQESSLLRDYRARVIDYNQDIKSAQYTAAARGEITRAARADLKPKLSASGNASYTLNPLEIDLDLPGMPITLGGDNHYKYGLSLDLTQDLYAGGAAKARYRQAGQRQTIAEQDTRRVTNDILREADLRYWQAVAGQELVRVAEEYRASMQRLVDVVRHRVEVEYTDRNDLLMAEVKLNEADYRLLQARDKAETARLALNAFAGIPAGEQLPVDTLVGALTVVPSLAADSGNARPELAITRANIELQQTAKRLADAPYRPRWQVGMQGSYTSPGYDFREDPDPNYQVYTRLSIPLHEWGKRRNTRSAADYNILVARETHSKTLDNIRLEIQTAHHAYTRAVEQVALTGNSLAKARESEELAMSQYREGKTSIVEAINAQVYHQQARVNHIQSKLAAQAARSDYARATGTIAEE